MSVRKIEFLASLTDDRCERRTDYVWGDFCFVFVEVLLTGSLETCTPDNVSCPAYKDSPTLSCIS